MKKLLCILISLMLVLSCSTSIAFAKNNKEDDLKYWKGQLKQWYNNKNKNSNKNQRNQFIKQIVDNRRGSNTYINIVFINGEELETDVAPVLKDGRTLLPLRAIANALKANVAWDARTNTVTITKNGTKIQLVLGSNIVKVNGKEYKIEVPAYSVKGRTVVPVRFIAEIFNQKVEWDEETGSIIISDGDDEDDDSGNGGGNTNPNPNTSNLAYNKTVRSSSDYSSAYSADKAVDGNTSTRWSSEFDDREWLYVDLGSTKAVNKVKLNWESAYAKSYKIRVSTNADDWTEVYSTTSGNGGTDEITFNSINARYVQLYATERATSYGYSLWEMEVYGTNASNGSSDDPGKRYEGENAILSGGAKVNNDHSGYSGSGFVDGYWNEGAATTFNVDVQSSGVYDVTLRYANDNGNTRTLSIYVNGTKVKQTSLSDLANWDTWGSRTERLELNSGRNTIAYKYTANDSGYVNIDNIKLEKVSSTTGNLTGSSTAPAYSVSLSSEGTRDWAHWGLESDDRFVRKGNVTQQISNYTRIGSTDAKWFSNNPVSFSWSGGTPVESSGGTPSGLYMTGEGNGFQITIPADTNQRTLKLYVGAWKAKGKLTASLSDGSASDYSSYLDSSSGTTCMVYTLNFKAASGGETLTIKYTLEDTYDDTYGNITLQAATLR